MPIDDRTTNRSYKLPNAGNLLADDVVRLRDALAAIDADIFARYTKTEVDQLITNLVQGAPGALDTLNELAAALGDDANFATTVTNSLALKANASDVYTKTEGDARYFKSADVIAPTVSSINAGPLAGFRNVIINGDFDIWQRGTSHSTVGYGSADRWSNLRSGSTCTISRQSFTLGQTDVPNNPTYFCRAVVTSSAGAANYSVLSQNIEGVRTFAGRTVTVSFWAKADATRSIAVELSQFFGTGVSASTQVTGIGSTKVSIGATWQKVTVTATVPSISGKTLGAAGDDWLGLVIWFDAGSDYNARSQSLGQQSGTFDIAQVQIEPGAVATPFERRPPATELSLCRRYGQWVSFNMLFYASVADEYLETSLSWPEMRRSPVPGALIADPNTSQANNNNATNIIGRATPYGGSCVLQATAGTASTYVTGYRSWLDAEL